MSREADRADGRGWAWWSTSSRPGSISTRGTLAAQFGDDRLRYFQPLQSIFEAGGDRRRRVRPHAEDRLAPVDQPVQPVPRHVDRRSPAGPSGYDGQLHPEEALTREQAIRFYTINNAHLLFLEDQIGSLEAGKLADLVVLDRDLLTCPVDDIKDTQVLPTYLGGNQVHPLP